ncbi:MAG: acyl-CoA N-acyltransferase [Benniella sp.]|nr:MAG: acyl-CoA N-acyltransferase [Benniella sp.]
MASSTESPSYPQTRPDIKTSVYVRLASPEDVDQLALIHSVINRAYRSEGGWTTEAHLVSEERITLQELEDSLNDKTHPVLIAFDSDTGHPLGTVQLEPAEGYSDLGEYKGEGYSPEYKEPLPLDQQVFLGLFSVDPSQQSRGIGRKLVEAALRHAKEEMKRSQCVVYVLHMRSELISWYKKLGFVCYGEKAPFPDMGRLKQDDGYFDVLRLAL